MDKILPSYVFFSPDVIFQAVHDEAVLLDMASEQYFALNELGMRMWQLLSENGNTNVALEQLLLEFEVDEATLNQDMANWIAELVELGLASVVSDAAP